MNLASFSATKINHPLPNPLIHPHQPPLYHPQLILHPHLSSLLNRPQEAIAGGGDNVKDLRHTYSDHQSALRAARREWNRLQRGSATLTYTLAKGRADLIPELTYNLQGIKPDIDATIWYSGNVQHSLSADSGYTMSLSLESKLPEDAVAELADDSGSDYTRVIAYYRDEKTGKERSVTAGDQRKPRRLAHLYSGLGSAERAVVREVGKTS